MVRLVRLNEVQYAETEAQKDALIGEGFTVDETASSEAKPEKADGGEKPTKRNKGGA